MFVSGNSFRPASAGRSQPVFGASKQTLRVNDDARVPDSARPLTSHDLDEIINDIKLADREGYSEVSVDSDMARRLGRGLIQRHLSLDTDQAVFQQIKTSPGGRRSFPLPAFRSMVMRLRPDWAFPVSISEEQNLQRLKPGLAELEERLSQSPAEGGEPVQVSSTTLFHMLLCIKRRFLEALKIEMRLLHKLSGTSSEVTPSYYLARQDLELLIQRARQAMQETEVRVKAQKENKHSGSV